jgi:hypothetical protein
MWKIKDPELKAKVNAFFSDEEINNAFVKNTDCYKYFRLATDINKSVFTFAIDKDLMEFIPDYNPDGWNPFPEVKPPQIGQYLVTRLMKTDRGNTCRFVQIAAYEYGHFYMKNDVIAFRELPVPYYERNPWEDDDNEPEEGD